MCTSVKNDYTSTDLNAISAYDYDLPQELIAAYPVARRDHSKLLVAHRDSGRIEHRSFHDLTRLLSPHDLLVFNNTRVIPGRIHTKKETGGRVELLVLDVISAHAEGRWTVPSGEKIVFRCMTRSSKPLRADMVLYHTGNNERASCVFRILQASPGEALVEASWERSPLEFLEYFGEMPLPPYIVQRREHCDEGQDSKADDQERYQTVYAKNHGAIAAPTAGLHFTDALIQELESLGVQRAFLTLQVGPGTFRPVSSETLDEHIMHREEYTIDQPLYDAITQAKKHGGRIIAVGTTSARALEAEALRELPFEPGTRSTDIFLRPGSSFRVCDGLITNFHLPRSTLLALVAAFSGYEFMQAIYKDAIAERYRFYSYGDSSIIL